MSSFEGISVIIPVHNREATIGRAIASVLKQSHPPDEVIVVDDGSTDRTPYRIADFGDRIHSVRIGNSGVSAARNTGIRAARHRWLAFLDSDDEWHPEKLKTQLQYLERNAEYRIIHTDEIWIRHGTRVNPRKVHQKSGGMIFEISLPRCMISPSSVMIKDELFDLYGLFDETLPACEDYDLWLRMTCREPVLYADTPLITKYGGHEDQLSRQFPAMDRFRIRVLQELIETVPLDRNQIIAATNQLLQKLAILEQGAFKRGKMAAWHYYRSAGMHYRKLLRRLGG